MTLYTLRRLLTAFIVAFGVCLLTFLAVNLSPGDTAETITRYSYVFDEEPPADAIEASADRYQLNDSLTTQFVRWMSRVVQGDFGESYIYNRPVISIVAPKLVNTLKLGFASLLIAVGVSLVLGMASAFRPGGIIDRLTGVLSLVLVSVPSFCLGLGLIIFFSIKLSLLPVSGMDNQHSWVLPTLTLALGMIPSLSQMVRESMVNIQNQEYITMAKTKGLSGTVIAIRHTLRNAAVPIITIIATRAGHILGGSVVVETVFSWPGVGKLLIDSIKAKDIPMLQCCVLIIAIGYSLMNLLADLSYAAVDPRIRGDKI